MAWRSDLNERLRQARPTPKWRAKALLAWKPALGVALAACLLMTVTLQTNSLTERSHSGNLEASLVAAFDDSTNSEEVAGPGLAMHEVSDTTQANDSSSDWKESDLTNL